MDNLNEMLADAINIGKVIADPKDVGGIKFAVIPADHKVESLEKLQFTDYAANPHRKKASVVVQDVASFLDYWGLYSDENSVVFGDRDKDSLVASLDYHCAGEGLARWRAVDAQQNMRAERHVLQINEPIRPLRRRLEQHPAALVLAGPLGEV